MEQSDDDFRQKTCKMCLQLPKMPVLAIKMLVRRLKPFKLVFVIGDFCLQISIDNEYQEFMGLHVKNHMLLCWIVLLSSKTVVFELLLKDNFE